MKLLRKPKSKWSRLVLAILIISAGYLIYNQYSIYSEKKNFERARADINEVYAEVVAKLGEPDNSDRRSTCSRTSVVFGQGDLSCDVRTDFLYGVVNLDEANRKFKEIQKIISSNGNFKRTSTAATSIKTETSADTHNASSIHRAVDDYRVSGLDCVAGYNYESPFETSLGSVENNKKTFFVSIGCYAPAKKEYYSLK